MQGLPAIRKLDLEEVVDLKPTLDVLCMMQSHRLDRAHLYTSGEEEFVVVDI